MERSHYMERAGSEFFAAYLKLRGLTDDDPEFLRENWQGDDILIGLAEQLFSSAGHIERIEAASRLAFAPHIPPEVIAARRDYEERWQYIVWKIADRELIALFDGLFSDTQESDGEVDVEPSRRDELDVKIENLKDEAKDKAGEIDHLVQWGWWKFEDNPEDYGWMLRSNEAWRELTGPTGLDVAGALWRRKALPFILIPSHVSSRYGEQERFSLYQRLAQAAQAFVFGAPYACLALQRAVLEEVLREHYAVRGETLQELIENVKQSQLGQSIWPEHLKLLQSAANRALHGMVAPPATGGYDRAIIKSFEMLRRLIENAPRRSRRP